VNKALTFLLLLLILLLHFPFLSADPRLTFCESRGPFTDEGFYLMQLRSHLARNGWNLHSADNLLKSPLFSLLHYAPMKIFGSSLLLARLWTMLLAFAPLLIIAAERKWKLFFPLFAVMVLMQEYVFDYYHYALSESVFCSLTLLGIWFLWKYCEGERTGNLLAALMLFGLLIWLKVQFAYALILLAALLFYISAGWLLKNKFKGIIQTWLYFFLFTLFFSGMYYLAWYYPNKDFYSYILSAVNKNNFIPVKDLRESFEFYHHHIFLIPENKSYTLLFKAGFVASLAGTATGAFDKAHRFLFVAFSIWFLVELHKLAFYYVPLRYLVPLFVSGLAMTAVGISGWLQFFSDKAKGLEISKVVRLAAFLAVVSVLAHRLMQYNERLSCRTYALREANDYMARGIKKGGWIAGNWAASLSWQIPNPSLPVWYNLLNDEKIFTEITPVAVITEQDENDSGGAYKSRGISLSEYSDSSRIFCIGRWEVAVYWINEASANKLRRNL